MPAVVCLPYRGEFGHEVMWHAPSVHALQPKDGGQVIVCCQLGNGALYPSADIIVPVQIKPDAKRREQLGQSEMKWLENIKQRLAKRWSGADFRFPSPSYPRQCFIPEPIEPYTIDADIVICPRKREYGSRKNWKLWPYVAHCLVKNYRVFATGRKESSFDDMPCSTAWEYERPLDATISAMLQAKCVVTTDNGLALLATLCGRPVFMVSSDRGNTAPGYTGIRMDRYNRLNHLQSKFSVVYESWENPDYILTAVESYMEQQHEDSHSS